MPIAVKWMSDCARGGEIERVCVRAWLCEGPLFTTADITQHDLLLSLSNAVHFQRKHAGFKIGI